MDTVTAFIDRQTGQEIHNIGCDCVDVETVYQPGKELEIHGVTYVVEEVIRHINGHVVYKVYAKAK